MKIIDFEKKGNVVRFFLTTDSLYPDAWGDDWNDRPYECNAGKVYDEYVTGQRDVAFPFDWLVLEPCDGAYNSEYCKEDMKNRRVPCLIAVPFVGDDYWDDSFEHWVGADGIIRIYFGDDESCLEKIEKIKGKW